MTEPARVPPAEGGIDDVDPAIVAIADRLSRGDLTALVDLVELRGAKVTSFTIGPRVRRAGG